MSYNVYEDGEYIDDEYEMEDLDDNMDDEIHRRDIGGSDSDVNEYDHTVRLIYPSNINIQYAYLLIYGD